MRSPSSSQKSSTDNNCAALSVSECVSATSQDGEKGHSEDTLGYASLIELPPTAAVRRKGNTPHVSVYRRRYCADFLC